MSKRSRLSKGVTVVCGTSFGFRQHSEPAPKCYRLNKSSKDLAEARLSRQAQLATLSFQEREDLLAAHENDADMWVDEDETAFLQPPPGEEGFFSSHAGGESQLQDLFLDTLNGGKRKDYRKRRDRQERLVQAWKSVMPHLVTAYLQFQLKGAPSPNTEERNEHEFSIEVISLEGRGMRTFFHSPSAVSSAVVLMEFGVIGASPEQPWVGFPVEMLCFYRQLRRVSPRFSLDAFAKALNHFHRVPHQPYLADQLSNAYDCYLETLRAVDHLVTRELGRDESWERKNVCAPCFYETEDEPPMKFRFLAAMDGNNSLKLIDSTFRAGSVRTDTRALPKGRWMPPEEVDVFKDEVRKQPQKNSVKPSGPSPQPQASTAKSQKSFADRHTVPQDVPPISPNPDGLDDLNSDEIAWLNVTETDELARCLNACVDRWRNAGPEARKKMFALFAVAGIFLSVCRHGHVLVICDMIRSGELMKYPIATVNRLLDEYGPDMCLGYDIMCAFNITLKRSSLGEKAGSHRFCGIVPAFHGHAHNRYCQLHWHPLYTDGVGLEDFEECERTFCRSNELASVTRLATPYHRQQHIEEHFRFHDFDKLASAGNFIYQNYRQALERIAIDGPRLAEMSTKLKIGAEDYERYLRSEQEYLEGLRTEPKEEQAQAEYMELLFDLDSLQLKSDAAMNRYRNRDHLIVKEGYTDRQITRITTQCRTTFQRWSAKNEEVLLYEEHHDIAVRWAPTSAEYQQGLSVVRERKYRRALDELERLVVQRLFEMTKLGTSGVGYKLREKISKSLKTRADAIQSALKRYNEVAVLMEPPRPTLSWESVINAVNLAEFDLLRDGRQDIRKLEWAQPAQREGMVMYFGIKRAKEEIVRLNVEIRRLLTFLYDDHVDHYRAIAANITVNVPLAFEISARWQYHRRIHEQIVKRLLQTSRLRGFSGALFYGERKGRDLSLSVGIPPPVWATDLLGISHIDVEVEEPNDESLEDGDDTALDVDTDIFISLLDSVSLADS